MSSADLDTDLKAALVTGQAIVKAVPRMLDLPGVLPVEHLSNSSITLLWKCPEKWRRRYVLREYEPPSGSMIVGSCAGAAARTNFEQKIDSGTDLSESDVLDAFADEWNERAADDGIDWKGEKPQTIRDSGQQALAAYHRLVAPAVMPTTTERKFTLRFDEVPWTFLGYLDLEESDGAVGDTKCTGRRLAQTKADVDPQPASYLLARRAEGNPAQAFRFHTMVRTKQPTAEVIETTRTNVQLDAFLGRIMAAAHEIAWRAEHDVWSGAVPGEWWCTEKFCGHWASCPMGGAA